MFKIILILILVNASFLACDKPDSVKLNPDLNQMGKDDENEFYFPTFRGKKENNYSENYFRIEDKNETLWNGKHWDKTSFPIAVLIKYSPDIISDESIKDLVEYAFKVWSLADCRIKYYITEDSSKADLIINFTERLASHYNSDYLGITEFILGNNNRIRQATITIALFNKNSFTLSEGTISKTIIHELGHAFGLGHSENYADIMYPYIPSNNEHQQDYFDLSTGDIEAVSDALDIGYNRLNVLEPKYFINKLINPFLNAATLSLSNDS